MVTHLASSLPINLKRIRSVKGFSQEELAQKASISRNAYRSIEKGVAEPRVGNLQNIADALGVKVFDLLRPLPKVPSLRFRSNKTLNIREKNKRQQHINDFAYWLRDFNFLECELKEKKTFKLEKLIASTYDPVIMAEKVRKVLKLADEPINDICGLVESVGIKVFLIDSDLKNFFGFCLSAKDGGPAIGVNKSVNINVERKIFTVAHELGHILLHPDSFHDTKSEESEKSEKEANIFASHLLMPNRAFEKELDKNIGLHWIWQILHIKRIFKVSYKTVLTRLIDKGLYDNSIWANFAVEYKKQFGGNLKNHREPQSISQDDFKNEPNGLDSVDFVESRLHKLVRNAFEQEIITMSKAAEILDISLMEMRERSKTWGVAI